MQGLLLFHHSPWLFARFEHCCFFRMVTQQSLACFMKAGVNAGRLWLMCTHDQRQDVGFWNGGQTRGSDAYCLIISSLLWSRHPQPDRSLRSESWVIISTHEVSRLGRYRSTLHNTVPALETSASSQTGMEKQLSILIEIKNNLIIYFKSRKTILQLNFCVRIADLFKNSHWFTTLSCW